MTITPLPEPPLSTSPADFDPKADAFNAALPVLVVEINNVLPTIDSAAANAVLAQTAATAAAAATGYLGTSSQSNTLTIGAGKNFATQTGKSFAVGDAVTCLRRGVISARLRGTVATYTSGTGAMTIDVTSVPGDQTAGSFTDWIVMSSFFEAPLPDEVIAAAMGVSLVL